MKRLFLLSLMAVLTGCMSIPSHDSLGRVHSYQPGHKQQYAGQKIVLVGGCFDLLHLGHIRFLTAAKEQGDYLIVALEPDSRISKYKKRKPVHTQEQRAEILKTLRVVDEVLLLPELNGFSDYMELVTTIHPQVIAATKGDPQLQNKIRQAQAVGAQMITVVDRLEPFSSSGILKSQGLPQIISSGIN